jgi:hypothetical protein
VKWGTRTKKIYEPRTKSASEYNPDSNFKTWRGRLSEQSTTTLQQNRRQKNHMYSFQLGIQQRQIIKRQGRSANTGQEQLKKKRKRSHITYIILIDIVYFFFVGSVSQ